MTLPRALELGGERLGDQNARPRGCVSVMRRCGWSRFFKAPRLILTVATIGVAAYARVLGTEELSIVSTR